MEKQTSYRNLSSRLHELLEQEAYSKTTLKDMEFILNSFAKYMDENGLENYNPTIGTLLVEYCKTELKVCSSRVSRAMVIVHKLDRLYLGLDGKSALWGDKTVHIDIPAEYQSVLKMYIDFCRENGNREPTIRYKSWICNRFLKNLSDNGCERISDIDGAQVQSAFLQLGFSRYWERVGPFLRFLFEKDLISHNYSTIMRYRKNKSVHPTVYSTSEISYFEKSVDRTTSAGIRNYAITLLLSRYGIRSCDIAALTFKNLDFDNNRICFTQRKTGDLWEGPLFPEVKTALLEYINNVRPYTDDCSHIFMTLCIPLKPLSCHAINVMIHTLFRNSKVDISQRKHGTRAFRSSIASNMINDRVPTEVVRRVLGHGTKYALRHYAKIDIESMRLCPLPVPEPQGKFADLLLWKGGGKRV